MYRQFMPEPDGRRLLTAMDKEADRLMNFVKENTSKNSINITLTMDENDKTKNQDCNREEQNDCNCEGDCCPPKKKNNASKILFIVILLAAIGVIAFKLVNKPAPAAVKESCCPSPSATGCDTTKKVTCDTTKGSSCCPK